SNDSLGRRFFAEQDRLRGGPAPELCAPDYVAYLGGNPPMDRAGHEAFANAFYAAFPDARHDIEAVFASGDAVAVRFVIPGTNTGSFFGIPPSNKRMSICANVLMRVHAGKVVELKGIFDEAGMLRHMGALPS